MGKHVSKAQIHPAPAALANALLQEVANIDADPEALLRRLKLPFALADLRSGRVSTLSRPHFARLNRECMAVLEEHACKLGVYPPMTQNEFDMLCYCVINCKTLGDVIERAANFCAMLGGRAGQLWVETEEENAAFFMKTFRGKPTASGLLVDITGLTAYHRLFSWLIGEFIEIAEIGVNYNELLSRELVFDLFHYPIAFNRPINDFRFPARYLARPVVRSYQELTELLKLFPFDQISTDLQTQTLADALHNIVMTKLMKQEPIPTIAQLASLFNISSATFRRRLDEEETSIKQIKEKCRRELAFDWLRDEALTLEEIAAHLGFSDANAFRRAFKSWTGVAPSDYRRSQSAGADLSA
jgi:AraC-like DNA-binding protein